jgi:polyisoprenoid-binding protein YceI
MKKLIIATIVLLNLLPKMHVAAQEKVYSDKKQSVISYSMNHPLHAWTADNNEITSIILTDENRSTIQQVAVSAKVASFDSKNANRDSHMIEILEAIKYPTITFESHSIKQDGDLLTVQGTMVFHGVKQDITFEAVKNTSNKNKLEITGNFIVKMTQFNIEPPSLIGMDTDDEIKISFKMIY